jgi:predicted anti-sigma-YlaC factor YlaD
MSQDANESSMTCKELVELVTAYLDDAMDHDTKALFEAHLELCRGCRNYLDQIRTAMTSVADIHEEALDSTFRNRLLTAFRDWNT